MFRSQPKNTSLKGRIFIMKKILCMALLSVAPLTLMAHPNVSGDLDAAPAGTMVIHYRHL